MSFSERLQELIPRGQIRATATKSGVHESTLRNYLSGTHQPPVEVLARIVEATGADLFWLVTGERSPLNPEALTRAISDVEEGLKRINKKPSPKKKAALIALAYEDHAGAHTKKEVSEISQKVQRWVESVT